MKYAPFQSHVSAKGLLLQFHFSYAGLISPFQVPFLVFFLFLHLQESGISKFD